MDGFALFFVVIAVAITVGLFVLERKFGGAPHLKSESSSRSWLLFLSISGALAAVAGVGLFATQESGLLPGLLCLIVASVNLAGAAIVSAVGEVVKQVKGKQVL